MNSRRQKTDVHEAKSNDIVPSPAVSPVKDPDSIIDRNTSVMQIDHIVRGDLKSDEVNDDVSTVQRLTFDTGSDNTNKDDILTYHSNLYYRASSLHGGVRNIIL